MFIRLSWAVTEISPVKAFIFNMNQNNKINNAAANPIPELLENEEMWMQRAIDTPNEVLDELRRFKEIQNTPNSERQ